MALTIVTDSIRNTQPQSERRTKNMYKRKYGNKYCQNTAPDIVFYGNIYCH